MVVGLELLRHAHGDPETILMIVQRLENSVRRMRALLDTEAPASGDGDVSAP